MASETRWTCDQCNAPVKVENLVQVVVGFSQSFSRNGDFCSGNCAEKWLAEIWIKVS